MESELTSSHKVWELLALTCANSLLNYPDSNEYLESVQDLTEFSVNSIFPPEINIDPVFWESMDAWKVGTLNFPRLIEEATGYPFKSIRCNTFSPV